VKSGRLTVAICNMLGLRLSVTNLPLAPGCVFVDARLNATRRWVPYESARSDLFPDNHTHARWRPGKTTAHGC
jgi:hypothetical protein